MIGLGAQAQLVDPSFEAGSPNPAWNEGSTNFGSPLCSPFCGIAGARTGDWYIWGGGVGPGGEFPEVGFVSQSMTIPEGSEAELQMYVFIPTNGDSLAADVLKVMLDGSVVKTITAQDQEYYNDYAMVVIDASSAADGNDHTLYIEVVQTTSSISNFFVDDIALYVDGVEETSVREVLNGENPIVVYPNPANEVIRLAFNQEVSGTAIVKVYDAVGALVNEETIPNAGSNMWEMSTNRLSNGVYTVSVLNDGNVYTNQVVVSK